MMGLVGGLTNIACIVSLALAAPSQTPRRVEPKSPAPELAPTERKAPAQPQLLDKNDNSWRKDHLRVLPPDSKGKGMWIAGIAAISAIFIKQTVSIFSCADPGCRSGRLTDRLLWLGGTAALTYASSLRAHHVAYHDALRQSLKPPSRRRGIWGAVLVGVGAAVFATDVGLQSACMLGKGPYFVDTETTDPNTRFFYGCKGWLGTALMDFGGAAIATGSAMLAWERNYQRDRNIYRRGRLRVIPTMGGLRAMGRF